MKNHLVTSIGRAGTKWLAECIGWPHEPVTFDGRAVSPRHLHLLATKEWVLPDDTRVTIITREPRAQMLSIINRWHALGNAAARCRSWLSNLDGYIAELDKLVKNGAQITTYEDLTHCHACLIDTCAELGLPTTCAFHEERFNSYPAKVKELPEWASKVAARLDDCYEDWYGYAEPRPAKA